MYRLVKFMSVDGMGNVNAWSYLDESNLVMVRSIA